jgi:hypothetical protein
MSSIVALFAVYIPILRELVYNFVRNWNRHKIRKQRDRPYSHHGQPSWLYENPPEGFPDCGIPVDTDRVKEIRSVLEDFGKLFIRYFFLSFLI